MIRKILASFSGQLVVALVGLAIVSACSLDRHADPAADSLLAGTDWNLKQLDGKPADSKRPLTLSLETNRLNGFGGCNHYFGNYTRNRDGALSISSLGTTKMACGGEADLLEQYYVGLLSQVKRYTISHEQLHLLGADRNILMVFSAAQHPASK